jgi:23S rRNA (adenine2503-C2)-methyltransferase
MSGVPAPLASLLDLRFVELQAQMGVWREPKFRAKQIWEWVYAHYAADFCEMTNLPQSLRERLSGLYRLSPLTPVDEWFSSDRLTHKTLFRLSDGETIESVLMTYERRNTVCVSSQVGCPIGCTFCATGQCGFSRHLCSGEIIAQPLYFARHLRAQGRSVSNIVVMGMGEPLLNYDAVWQAVETWNDRQGFDLGARRITLSTAGYVPGIERLAQESLQVGLAVSLHAADDGLRDQLVPLNQTYPLAELMGACREYVRLTHRRVTIEYALIDQVNDSVAQAHRLAELLRGLLCHVNLIPLNPTADGQYRPSTQPGVHTFARTLQEHQIPTTVRLGRGVDIEAGCGQLRSKRSRP